ncbi:hypothetical protein PG994_004177 [Apiospora phragmitis]|uniref:Uncharacterized protein n=1 Tax=Apiospora phragmitis TaxID=2905665 RepID=A0ABR1VTW4_9PEZI
MFRQPLLPFANLQNIITGQYRMAASTPNSGGDASFRNFMLLPGELRNEIWRLSLPRDRVLLLSMFAYHAEPLAPPVIAWVVTWFAPAHDRVLLAVEGYRRFRWPWQHLGPLALDAQHILLQTAAFFPGAPSAAAAPELMERLVRSGLEVFPNARSVGAVRACFVVRERRGEREGEGKGKGRNGLYWHYRPLDHTEARGFKPRVRVLSDPTYIGALEAAHAQLTAPCSCQFEEGGEEEAGTDDGGSGERRLLQRQPTQQSHHHHHDLHDHGLSGLWSPPASPNEGSSELWPVLKCWFGAQKFWSPTAGSEPQLGEEEAAAPATWASELRTWIASIGRQAPHVYLAEMKVYNDGVFGASSIPSCVARGGERVRPVSGG